VNGYVIDVRNDEELDVLLEDKTQTYLSKRDCIIGTPPRPPPPPPRQAQPPHASARSSSSQIAQEAKNAKLRKRESLTQKSNEKLLGWKKTVILYLVALVYLQFPKEKALINQTIQALPDPYNYKTESEYVTDVKSEILKNLPSLTQNDDILPKVGDKNQEKLLETIQKDAGLNDETSLWSRILNNQVDHLEEFFDREKKPVNLFAGLKHIVELGYLITTTALINQMDPGELDDKFTKKLESIRNTKNNPLLEVQVPSALQLGLDDYKSPDNQTSNNTAQAQAQLFFGGGRTRKHRKTGSTRKRV
jgi:hypothetical protein